MKLHRLILISVLFGALSVVGCGDEGGSSTDDGSGSGNGSASQVCAPCDARQNECEQAYNVCIAENTGAAQDDCDEIALLACEVSQ